MIWNGRQATGLARIAFRWILGAAPRLIQWIAAPTRASEVAVK